MATRRVKYRRMTATHPDGRYRRTWHVPAARYEATKAWLKKHGFRVLSK